MISLDLTHNGDTITLNESITFVGVAVPKGFTSNGLSVPRALRFIAQPFGRYLVSALVHDSLSRCDGVSNRQARQKFELALFMQGASTPMIFTLVSGVRLNDFYCRHFHS